MWVCKGLLLIFFIGILPYLLGLLPVSFMRREDSKPGIILIAGWFLMFALFQLIAVPVIILQQSFTLLVILYDIVLCLVLAVSIVRGRDILRWQIQWIKDTVWTRHKEKEKVRIGMIAGLVCMVGLLALQVGATITLEHYDGDDAYYVAASVATDLYDTMYLRDNYTGYQFTLESRHALSPTPVFISWISRMTGIHATILAHSVLGPLWICLMYVIYWQIADKLFTKQKQYKPWFMCFLMLWFLFGNVSIYTTETFSLTRIWQGKGLVAAIIIPTMFLCLLQIYEKQTLQEQKTGYWLLLVEAVFAAVLATSTSIFLTPILLGLAALLFGIRLRSRKLFLQLCFCTVPALIYGVMYIFLR